MTHVRSFWVDYWRWIAGVAAWVLLVATCFLVPASATYWYALVWAGAGTVASAVFVVGYMRYSKPTKDPVTRKRAWNGIWVWFLAESLVLVLVLGMTFTLRFVNADAAIFTDDRVAQYRGAAAVFLTSFLQQVWLLWMWVTQQIHTRRRIRDAASEPDQV